MKEKMSSLKTWCLQNSASDFTDKATEDLPVVVKLINDSLSGTEM